MFSKLFLRTLIVRGVGTMYTLWTMALVICITSETMAQKQTNEYYGQDARAIIAGADYVKQNADSEFPSFVRFSPGSEIPVDGFFEWFQSAGRSTFQPEFQLVEEITDELGLHHLKYIQSYQGIPIDQSNFSLHTKAGKVFAFNGTIKKITPQQLKPILKEDEALKMAMRFVRAEQYMWEDPLWEADLKERKKDPAATYYPIGKIVFCPDKNVPGQARLGYVFDISVLSPMKQVMVCVDAVNGEIIYDVPMESNCSAATVNTIFNGNQGINTDFYNGADYRLRDDCTAAVIHVRDWNSVDLTPNPVEIENNTNTWTTMNEIFGGTTLWCVKQAYNYFLSRYSRDAYDDANGDVDVYINALFNCAPPAGCVTANNASMNFSTQTMKVGLSSAGVLTNSYATIDIIGHEYAHAVTAASAGLVYEEEWGALNESFSDIFGEAAEFFTFGANDWLMGSERDNGAIRSLSNPNAGGDPDTYLGTNWLPIVPPCDGSNDQCGVHRNSGVQNFWFYLVSVGGSGTNDNGDDYEVNGIGILDAEAIAYRNLTVYLGANSDYADARTGSIQASIDLFGLCSDETEAVMDAWHAVGVGDPFLNVTATVTSNYNGADVSCFGAADGSASAAAAQGLAPYTYSWSNGQNGSAATGLSAGTYTVTVTDALGCTATDEVTLTNPPMLSATVSINSDYNGWPISCFGACDGIVEANPSGGVGPYTYLWGATARDETTKIVSGLCAGTHTVTVTDANGCSTTADVTLTEPPPLEIEAGDNQTIFYWDLSMACTTLEATGADGGVPPYTYSWSSGGTEAIEDVCLEVWEDTITIVTYYVTLTDVNGCEVVDSLDVCYVDINCGKSGPTKVSICHYPPDNPLNPLTLCVSLSSLPDHLSHGDQLAACEFVSPCGGVMAAAVMPDVGDIMAEAAGDKPVLEAFPNPFSEQTTVRFILHDDHNVRVGLYDLHGKLIYSIYSGDVSGGEINDVELQQGRLPAGIYILSLYSPDLNETIRRQLILH